MYIKGIAAGEVKVRQPQQRGHYIRPDNIGRVRGHILVRALEGTPRSICLFGEKLIHEERAAKLVGEALGKNL